MDKERKELLKIAMSGVRSHISRCVSAGKEPDMVNILKTERSNVLTWLIVKNRALKGNRVKMYKTRESRKKAEMEEEQELRQELDRIFKSIFDELQTKNKNIILSLQKKMRIRQINESNAIAIINGLLESAGYTEYFLEKQSYRIKIWLRLGTRRLVIPLKYSAFPGIAERILPTIAEVEKSLNDFGKDFRLL